MILARVGLPCREKGISVITLVVEATTDELGSLSGRLGKIAGVGEICAGQGAEVSGANETEV
jgi:putative iron-only hydrogenase system regulator